MGILPAPSASTTMPSQAPVPLTTSDHNSDGLKFGRGRSRIGGIGRAGDVACGPCGSGLASSVGEAEVLDEKW